MSKSYSLDKRLKVLSPCDESWETMKGNDQIRFCSHCQKNVHNISSMTKEQVIELAFESKGRLCVRYYKKPDESIKFVPSKPEAETKNLAFMKFAAGLFFATVLTTSTPSIIQAQNTTTPETDLIAVQQERTAQDPLANEPTLLKGVVKDQQGAVIPGTTLTLINKRTNASWSTLSDELGNFSFSSIPEDDYLLVGSAEGFNKVEIELSNLNLEQTEGLTISMEVANNGATVEGLIISLSPGEEMLSYYKEQCKIRDSGFETPELPEEIKDLFYMVESDDIKKVKAQLKIIPQLNIINEEGETLLSHALRSEKMIKFLLKSGADVNMRSKFLATALMYTVVRDNTRIAKLLIDKGASLDAVDINGRSAVIFAAADNNLDMLELLLASGANPNIRDAEGKTALSYAIEHDFKEVKRLLKSIGAKK